MLVLLTVVFHYNSIENYQINNTQYIMCTYCVCKKYINIKFYLLNCEFIVDMYISNFICKHNNYLFIKYFILNSDINQISIQSYIIKLSLKKKL